MSHLVALGKRVRPLLAIGALGIGLWSCSDDSGTSQPSRSPDSSVADSSTYDALVDTGATPESSGSDSGANDVLEGPDSPRDASAADSAVDDALVELESAPDSNTLDSGSSDGQGDSGLDSSLSDAARDSAGQDAEGSPDSKAVDSASADSSEDAIVGEDSSSDSSTPDSAAIEASSDGGAQTFVVMVAASGAHTFDPSTVTIHVGDTVQWQWQSGGHTVTSGANCTADNTFCSPSDMNCSTTPTSASGSTYSHVFMTAGSYAYFCRPHCAMGMTGTVVVQ